MATVEMALSSDAGCALKVKLNKQVYLVNKTSHRDVILDSMCGLNRTRLRDVREKVWETRRMDFPQSQL